MIRHFFKVAVRTLRKNKIYTFINLLGLTVGIAAVLLIFRVVHYELSFNKHFANYDRIVRVVSEIRTAEESVGHNVCVPVPAMAAMEQSVSQFETQSRIRETWSGLTVPDPMGGPPLKKFVSETGETGFFAETSFFQIFDLEWLAGDPATALDEPGTIVLNRTWAEKCFDRWENAIGQTVLIDNLFPVTVKGVIEDLPKHCDFVFPYLISFSTLKSHPDYFFYDDESWGNCSSNYQVYALLKDPAQFDAANAALAKVGEEEYTHEGSNRRRYHVLQPLSDLHYSEDYHHSGLHQTSKSRLKVLGAIGILILIMACFNFINLATAQATLRAKEVGVRKTLGGRRGQLAGQFMSETGLIVLVAVILGVNLASISAPLLKQVSHVPDDLPFLSNPQLWLFIGLTAVCVTLLAGLYPALTLAGFEPVKALKNKVSDNSFSGPAVRKSLVVLQFVIAQGLIMAALISLMQLDYVRSRDLGFKKDLVYTFGFNFDSTTVARQGALRQGLLGIPAVESVSFSSDQPLSGNTWASNFRYSTRPEDEQFAINLKFCDEHYRETYGIELMAGRWLNPSDTMRETVVNHTLLKKLGIADAQEVIGQNLRLGSSTDMKIVGVAEDFHTHSLRKEHEPLMMSTRKAYYWEAGVKIRPDDIAGTTAAIRQVYDRVLPEQVFSGNFLDERIAGFYEDDNRLAATCRAFGLLAILISCLGLFGLATHAAAQRVKEIGIRKVLGASTSGIIGLLSKDFLKLVVIALVIASPLAWYLMNSWLAGFAYRIEIGWGVFLLTGGIALAIAFLTVSYQSVKAAVANPVQSLRSE